MFKKTLIIWKGKDFNTTTVMSMTQQQKLLLAEAPQTILSWGKKCLAERPQERCIFTESWKRQTQNVRLFYWRISKKSVPSDCGGNSTSSVPETLRDVSVDDGNVNDLWDAERVGAGCVSFQGTRSEIGSKPASLDGTGMDQCQEMLTSTSLSFLLASCCCLIWYTGLIALSRILS